MNRARARALYKGGRRLDLINAIDDLTQGLTSVSAYDVEEWPDGQVVVRLKVSILRAFVEPRALSAAVKGIEARLPKGGRVVVKL